MPHSLTPYELGPAEWFISYPEWRELCGYEEFSSRLYPNRDACEKAIDALNTALPELLMAAAEVVDSWESGDLAQAVRDLRQVLKDAWKRE